MSQPDPPTQDKIDRIIKFHMVDKILLAQLSVLDMKPYEKLYGPEIVPEILERFETFKREIIFFIKMNQ